MTNTADSPLRAKLLELLEEWKANKFASRYEIEQSGHDLLEWKTSNRISGIWNESPLMITATLDDALGQGIELIQLFAQAAGMEVIPLGICRPATAIITECKKHLPDLLGLTVLRSDVEEDLIFIGQSIPSKTRLIAGGGPLLSDAEIIRDARICFVAKDIASFVRYMLDFKTL